MPNFEDNKGFKMPGPSMHGGTQKHTDATNSKRAADIKTQKASCSCGDKSNCDCGGNPPSKFLMKAAGMLIGANKRRQAGKDAADAKKGEAYQNMSNRKLS